MKKNILGLLILFLGIVFANNAFAKSTNLNNQVNSEIQNKVVASESSLPKSHVEKGFESVSDLYNKMLVGYKKRALDQVLETIADNNDVVFIGSGARYVLIGKDEIKKGLEIDFGTLEDVVIDVPWVSIRGEGNTAWLSSLVDISYKINGEEYKKNSRQSLVFQKIGEDWKIVSSHFSFPAEEVEEEIVDDESVEKTETEEEGKTPLEEIEKY